VAVELVLHFQPRLPMLDLLELLTLAAVVVVVVDATLMGL